MVEERGGWFVVNVEDCSWYASPAFGKRCRFEKDSKFPQTGVNIAVIEPGQPACRYHREEAQEDFLVLSGECKVLINGEERSLKAWDYVHCPPGVSHVFVGAGDGPCAVLMIGHRPGEPQLYYPAHPPAKAYNAEAPEATPDPRKAYADVPRWEPGDPPMWPL